MRNSKSKSKQQTGRRGGGGRGIGSTTNPKRRKTRSTSKKESFSTAEHLASATVVLTENGWLPSPAARTLCALELTCRSTSSIRLKDEAWKALCCNIWPSTGEINSNYIHQSFGGYKTFYRHRSTPVQRYQQPIPRPLPPPKLTQGDFALLVDIYDKNLNPAMSRLITGDELRQLVEDGELTLVFKRSFCYELGRAKCFFEGCTCSVKCKFEHEHEDDNRMLYNPRVFFLRLSDSSSAPVFDSPSECEWSRDLDAELLPRTRSNPDESKYDWEKSSMGTLNFYCGLPWQDFSNDAKGLNFQQTAAATEILRRFRNKPISFSFDIHFDVLAPGDKVGITGFSIALVLGKITNEKVFGTEVQKKYGVSPLHILEQIQTVRMTPEGRKLVGSNAAYSPHGASQGHEEPSGNSESSESEDD